MITDDQIIEMSKRQYPQEFRYDTDIVGEATRVADESLDMVANGKLVHPDNGTYVLHIFEEGL